MQSCDVQEAGQILRDAGSLLVLTGAGTSAESGIPTYRGEDGLYADPSNIVTRADLERDPVRVWKWVDQHRTTIDRCAPNDAHRALAKWETEGAFERFLIGTQNVDEMHQKAGSRRVSELHGNIWQIACRREQQDYGDDETFSEEYRRWNDPTRREAVLEKWSKENGHDVWVNTDVPFASIPPYDDPSIRPHVLLFNEDYGHRLLWLNDFISHGVDVVLVIGCSHAVSVVPRTVEKAKSQNPACKVIEVNPGADHISNADMLIREKASAAMEYLSRYVG